MLWSPWWCKRNIIRVTQVWQTVVLVMLAMVTVMMEGEVVMMMVVVKMVLVISHFPQKWIKHLNSHIRGLKGLYWSSLSLSFLIGVNIWLIWSQRCSSMKTWKALSRERKEEELKQLFKRRVSLRQWASVLHYYFNPNHGHWKHCRVL